MFLKTPLTLLSPSGSRARLSILIFHRVLSSRDPLFPSEIVAAEFENICVWMSAMFNVLRLDDAVARLASDSLPARAACITFDDGYADNFTEATPILRRHGLQATFYIATGYLDGGRMWNDTIIESIRLTRQPALDFASLGIDNLAILNLSSISERRSAIDIILRSLKHLRPEHRLALTEEVADLANVNPSRDLMLTSDQVRRMHADGMLIGAHTVTHPILSTLSVDEARQEVDKSRESIECLLGVPVRHFAYPNGKPGLDYSDDAVCVVRDLGFDSAVSTAWGAASRATDRFQLPRFTPWDLSPTRFGLRMMRNLWSS